MTIQAVVFDIGNVLIEWQPERYYDRVIGPEKRAAFFDAIDLHGMNDRVDRGENFTDVIEEVAAANPDWSAEVMMWHDHWVDMATPPINHSVRLLRALLRVDVPVFALSNFGIEPFELGLREYPFLEEFDKRYISGHMGVAKPDAAIYQMVEVDCGVPPAQLLFVDDRQDNIDAAAVRGWQTHLFETPEGWAARLVAQGLLTQEDAQ
ncbi:MAG: HAD family phosphatase [Octadecabacter sp.]|nr:HAD family phosphatase [Octadecabacter sp.]